MPISAIYLPGGNWLWLLAAIFAALGIVAVRAFLAAEPDKFNMSRGQLGIAGAVLAFLFLASAWDIVCSTEHYPFSCYPMYSGIIPAEKRGQVVEIRAYGVLEDGREIFPRRYGEKLFQPLDASRARFAANHGNDQAAEALFHMHRRVSDSPRLAGVRIYRLTWDLDPLAANKDQPRRELLGEYP